MGNENNSVIKDLTERKASPKLTTQTWKQLFDIIGEGQEIKIKITDKAGKINEFSAKTDYGTMKQAVSSMIYAAALKGDLKALNIIMERTEGKVAQQVNILSDTNKYVEYEDADLKKITDLLTKEERIVLAGIQKKLKDELE